MKRIEIIIPHRELKEAHEILKNVNSGGMGYYTIEGSGRIKADPIKSSADDFYLLNGNTGHSHVSDVMVFQMHE